MIDLYRTFLQYKYIEYSKIKLDGIIYLKEKNEFINKHFTPEWYDFLIHLLNYYIKNQSVNVNVKIDLILIYFQQEIEIIHYYKKLEVDILNKVFYGNKNMDSLDLEIKYSDYYDNFVSVISETVIKDIESNTNDNTKEMKLIDEIKILTDLDYFKLYNYVISTYHELDIESVIEFLKSSNNNKVLNYDDYERLYKFIQNIRNRFNNINEYLERISYILSTLV